MSSSLFRGRLRAHDFFERGLGHALLPSRIAQLEPVPAGIEEIEFPSREITFRSVSKLNDGDFLFVKHFARLHKCLRAHRERMMHALFYLGGFIDGTLTLAEQD